MLDSNVLDYADWAAETYEQKVHPVISSKSKSILGQIEPRAWLDTCNAGSTPDTRHRLFPGSLFLLLVKALGSASDETKSEHVAAAIELLHNASLVHDDVLDNHSSRKAQPTLLSLYGSATALLGGDGLMATAFRVLAEVPASKLPGCIDCLGVAMENLVAGQLLDEPAYWEQVPAGERFEHWLKVCKGKLSVGNVGGALAAHWLGKQELENDLSVLLDEFSIISQIINDFGDLLGFTGYHKMAPSLRIKGEEAFIKPTLPLIWAGRSVLSELDNVAIITLLEKAKDEVSGRKEVAIRRLKHLPLNDNEQVFHLLYSFFNSPSF